MVPKKIKKLNLKDHSGNEWSAGPSGMRNFVPVRYGTVFLQNPGILVFFGTVLALYFHLRIFWELFEFFVFSL